jgi:hypothetical protein
LSPLAAIDCIQPAIELTKQRLFRPVKYSMWWRIAFLGVFSGEMSGGNGFHFNSMMPSAPSHAHQFATNPGMIVALALSLAALGLALILAFMYISSVLRFVLFDAVLNGRYRIREGWRMWRERAIPYFRLQVLTFVTLLVGLVILIGTPLGVIYSRGVFQTKHWDADSILIAVVGGLLAMVWLLGAALFVTLSKDFVLPMMALEGVDYDEGWRRLLHMMSAEKKSYVFYILMKIVLAISGTILLSLAAIVAILAAGIPLGIVAVIVYVVFKAQLTGALLIAAIALLVTVFVVLIFSAFGFLSAPLAVFYPAYSIYFFAGRYEALKNAMAPQPPTEPPSEPLPPVEPLPAS